MKNPVFQKIRSFTLLVGEGALDLAVNLVVMVMVERSLGVSGLGIFSYLISLLVFAGFFSDFGLSGYLEREVAITQDENIRQQVTGEAAGAILMTSLVCAALFFLFAVSGITLTRLDERSAAYVIMGVTIFFRNFNRLRIAVLQGRGEYDTAATLKTFKRLFLLAAVFVFLGWNLAPSYLMLAYLVSEIGLTVKSVKKIRLPKTGILLKSFHKVRLTLERGVGFFLTDEALDAVFYMDFLILGFFVTSRDLGLYAQASILARAFLLIPVSIKPVFLGQYCALAAKNRLQEAAGSIRLTAAILFFVHSVLALYILLFFSDILQAVFEIHKMSPVPFYIFAEILPGLLFFSAVASQEPVYEADGQVGLLQGKIMMVAVINLCLNAFFIPFAGLFGAAFATSASMFAYFMFFGRRLSSLFQIDKLKYVFAGAAVYLTFMTFQALGWRFAVSAIAVPAFLFLLLTMMGFFYADPEKDLQLADLIRLTREIRIKMAKPQRGGFEDGRQ